MVLDHGVSLGRFSVETGARGIPGGLSHRIRVR